jgi:hypothetical protein
MEQQLLMGSKRTLNETLRQILQLEIAKLTVGSSIRPWKMRESYSQTVVST